MADYTTSLGRILVIIPTYNEMGNLDMITGRIRRAVPEVEILIADDNSPDGTGERADELAAADDHIKVLHRKGKEGLTAAYIASFRWGLEHGYDVLIEHDADGSHQPEELHRLLDALVAGADMVKGSRWVKGGSVVNWPLKRVLLSRAGSVWTRLMLGIPVKDITGGLNAFKANVLADIVDDVQGGGYGIQRDLTWHAHRKGYKIVEVPIEFKERREGVSKMGSDVVVEALKNTTQMGMKHRGAQLKVLAGKAGRFLGGVAKQAAAVVSKTITKK